MIESRLKATEEKLGECCLPRIIRLCRKLNFTRNETSVAIYCLVNQIGQTCSNKTTQIDGNLPRRIQGIQRFQRVSRRSSGSDCISISQFLDIPIMDLLSFIMKERYHIKQALFTTISDSFFLTGQVSYDAVFCKVLMGCKVTSQLFLKLEQSTLKLLWLLRSLEMSISSMLKEFRCFAFFFK